jgi:hypothetical protein
METVNEGEKKMNLETIKEMCITVIIVITFIGFIFLCAWMYPTMMEVRKMDCAMAEFSPDISTEIKQLCREARSKK